MTSEENSNTGDQKEWASDLTTNDNSIAEKSSPSSRQSTTDLKAEDPIKAEDPTSSGVEEESDDETRYPKTLTKVLVGVGLALAVFLVRRPFLI
jgi:hypothetical protein